MGQFVTIAKVLIMQGKSLLIIMCQVSKPVTLISKWEHPLNLMVVLTTVFLLQSHSLHLFGILAQMLVGGFKEDHIVSSPLLFLLQPLPQH